MPGRFPTNDEILGYSEKDGIAQRMPAAHSRAVVKRRRRSPDPRLAFGCGVLWRNADNPTAS